MLDSTVRVVTERHGKAMHERQELDCKWPESDDVGQVIAQTDKSMVTVVGADSGASNKHKGNILNWKAIRLVLANEHKRVKVQYGGNFSGGFDETGRQLYDSARRAGYPVGFLSAVDVLLGLAVNSDPVDMIRIITFAYPHAIFSRSHGREIYRSRISW